MPELPEVEIIRRGLEKTIVGKRIAGIEVRVPKIFRGVTVEVIGRKITGINRRAKQIIIALDGEKDLLIHLKMTGQLIYDEPGKRVAGGHPSADWVAELPSKYSHVIFTFSDKSKLFFNDMRKFGWIKVLKTDEINQSLDKELGIEPFDKEFTTDKFQEIVQKKPGWNIKKVLTDQSLISGIGNIYADEALFWAGIRPTKLVKDLTGEETKKLHPAIIKVLEIGLKFGGSSENTYVKVDGTKGKAQEHFQVYSRKDADCRCGGKIEKIRLNGRGTHFCPSCQK